MQGDFLKGFRAFRWCGRHLSTLCYVAFHGGRTQHKIHHISPPSFFLVFFYVVTLFLNQLQLRLPQPCAVPTQEHPSVDLGPRAGDIVASVEDLVFAAASAMVFLGPQAPPMPAAADPPSEPEQDNGPIDPSSAVDGDPEAGVGDVVAAAATAAAGAAAMRRAGEHYGEENYHGASSPAPVSPVAVPGPIDGSGGGEVVGGGGGSAMTGVVPALGRSAPGVLDGGREGSGHAQPGAVAEYRRGSSSSPTPNSFWMSSVSPTDRSPAGGGPSVLGEVGFYVWRDTVILFASRSLAEADLCGESNSEWRGWLEKFGDAEMLERKSGGPIK